MATNETKESAAKAVVPVEDQPKPHTPSGKTIEEYAEELGTDPSTFAGVKMRERWPSMKRVTKRQYEKAVDDFVNGPTVVGRGE